MKSYENIDISKRSKNNVSELKKCIFVLYFKGRVALTIVNHDHNSHILGGGEEIPARILKFFAFIENLDRFPLIIIKDKCFAYTANPSFVMVHENTFVFVKQMPIIDKPLPTFS